MSFNCPTEEEVAAAVAPAALVAGTAAGSAVRRIRFHNMLAGFDMPNNRSHSLADVCTRHHKPAGRMHNRMPERWSDRCRVW